MVEELKLISKSLAIVNLNVGGHLFTTSVQTLTKDPNSMLAAMFSGSGELILREDKTFLKELETEARFYQIQGILDEFKMNSEILTNQEHRSQLLAWLPHRGGECRLRLLFRASRDGFTAATFHSRCDNKGPTVTIVKSGNNIFGGFTEKSWVSSAPYIICEDAFLFSMVNPYGLGPTKMPLKSHGKNYAIYSDISYGPTFGRSQHDLHISENANMYPLSDGYPGTCYECPPGHLYPSFRFFTESRYVTNYEVFAFYN
ncbi:hypothetical protein ACROYT_G042336 [Oculina patagonica]